MKELFAVRQTVEAVHQCAAAPRLSAWLTILCHNVDDLVDTDIALLADQPVIFPVFAELAHSWSRHNHLAAQVINHTPDR